MSSYVRAVLITDKKLKCIDYMPKKVKTTRGMGHSFEYFHVCNLNKN